MYFWSSHSLYLIISACVGWFLTEVNLFCMSKMSSGISTPLRITPSSYIFSNSCWEGDCGRTFSISKSGFFNSASIRRMRWFVASPSAIACDILSRSAFVFFSSRPNSMCISSIWPVCFHMSRTTRKLSVTTCSTTGLLRELWRNVFKYVSMSSGLVHFCVSMASEWRPYTI